MTLLLASYVAFISNKSEKEAVDLVPFRKGRYGMVWNLIDPASPESIRKGYEYISSHVSSLVQSGFENVKRFHVNRVARQYYDIYTSLYNETNANAIRT